MEKTKQKMRYIGIYSLFNFLQFSFLSLVIKVKKKQNTWLFFPRFILKQKIQRTNPTGIISKHKNSFNFASFTDIELKLGVVVAEC